MSTFFRKVLPILAVLAALGIGIRLYYLQGDRDDDRERKKAQRFQEAAQESGIDFRMNFLPSEQGETFKINLYDHGCGLAVGDFDGDGHDDIYFVNQLGPNALYRNKGDGTFEDVTDEGRRRPGRPRLRGRHLRRLRQRRPPGPVRHQHARRQRPVPQQGRRHLQGRHRGGRPDATSATRRPPSSSTTTTTATSTCFVTNTAQWTTDKYDKAAALLPRQGRASGAWPTQPARSTTSCTATTATAPSPTSPRRPA